MKVFLLAAGIGSRLRPITNNTPKCLVQINGTPLIDYWLRLFKRHGIKDILINSHYLHDQVESYLKRNNQGLSISLFYEGMLLGSLGTLIKNTDQFTDDGKLLVCYSDNLTNTNLSNLIKYHDSHSLEATIGLFKCDNPKQCGIVELDRSDTVVGFEEKPKKPTGNLANAGIYIFNTSIFNSMGQLSIKSKVLDIGHDLLPKLVGKMKGYQIPEFLIDIGSIASYKIANKYIKSNTTAFFKEE